MPDPKKYESEDKWMSACVSRMVDERKPQKQAVAACLNMWRNKEADEPALFTEEELEEAAIEYLKREGYSSFEEAIEHWGKAENYPPSDYLVVEDPKKRSTYHLQVKRHGKPDHNLMAAARAALTSNHRGNPYQGPNKAEALAKLKRLYSSEGMDWKEVNSFLVFKDKQTGEYRWLAIYSNKFRDRDNPPEILSSKAHKEFVEAVDSGEWPMPELWLWHVEGTRSGAADWVAYDDSGFSLASGTFDEGKERVAEFLSQRDDLRTSHGMPVAEIQRDKEDSSIITRYRSIEISPLPGGAAANPFTGFAILKEMKMALPDRKKPFLEEALGEEAVEELEQTLADGAKELEEAQIESKEEEPVEEVQEEAPPEEAKEEEAAEAPQYVTYDELEEVFAGHVKPLVSQLRSALDEVASQREEIKALQAQVKELQKDDETKLKEALQVTPAASLFSRIGSVIGSDEAAVDGRTSLAKSAPEETREPANSPTFVPGLNEYIARQWEGNNGR